MHIEPVEFIQSMLAPGIMISACGLLLLGMNNKYSIVVGRIRLLDEEIRRFKKTQLNGKLLEFELLRKENISLQIGKLYYRIRIIRNAVIFYSLAVAFFILSSLMIGYQLLTEKDIFSIVFFCFLTGMLSVLIGVYFAVSEMLKAYQIVGIEVKDM
jgi:hypothetical protein